MRRRDEAGSKHGDGDLKFGRTNSNKRNLGLGRINDGEGDLELDRKKRQIRRLGTGQNQW